jgi:hypothetical protein
LIDQDALTPIVRAALGRPAAEVVSWRSEPIGYVRVWQGTGGVERVAGVARDSADELAWSCVRKVVRAPGASGGASGLAGSLDPSAPGYWRREAELFGAGLLDALPADVAAPRCYGVEERRDELWLWLEELAENGRAAWTLDDYAFAARRLGRFNGRFLAGSPMPEHPALCRSTLRDELAEVRALGPIPDAVWGEPRVRALLGDTFGGRLAAAWARADDLAATVDRLPATFVHRDAFRANLMRRGDGLVAIDWALAGPGRLGEELFKMLLGSCALLHWEGGAAALDAAIFRAYVDGLREAGWAGDERQLRFGYAARAVAVLPRVRGVLQLLLDPPARERAAARFGRPAERVAAIRADFNRFALDLVDEAAALSREPKR